jgi:type II secretory pathway pseudopilin PulG
MADSALSRRLLGGVVVVGVVALLVAGFLTVGSPRQARDQAEDSQRASRLFDLHNLLSTYASIQGNLPDSLDDFEDLRGTPNAHLLDSFETEFDPRRDPGTGEEFAYEKVDDDSYRVCATFKTSSEDSGRGFSPIRGQSPDFYNFDAGLNCFDVDADFDLFAPIPKPGTELSD